MTDTDALIQRMHDTLRDFEAACDSFTAMAFEDPLEAKEAAELAIRTVFQSRGGFNHG